MQHAAFNSDLRPGMWASVQDYAKKSGLKLAEPDRVPSTRLAHLWVNSIQNRDVKKSLIERIYQAYLSDKKDIGQVGVLVGIAEELKLPRGAAQIGLPANNDGTASRTISAGKP